MIGAITFSTDSLGAIKYDMGNWFIDNVWLWRCYVRRLRDVWRHRHNNGRLTKSFSNGAIHGCRPSW